MPQSRNVTRDAMNHRYQVARADLRALAEERPQDLTLYTTEEAAALLRVHPETMCKWRRQGVGPHYVRYDSPKKGHVFYRELDLRRFLTINTRITDDHVTGRGDPSGVRSVGEIVGQPA